MVDNTPNMLPERTPGTAWLRFSDLKARLTSTPFTKDRSGHGYKYVPLEDIQRVITPLLAEHSLILVDSLCCDMYGKYGLTTELRDIDTGYPLCSSHFVFNCEPAMGLDKRGNPTLSYGTAQDIGSWRTYAARYNRATLLDLVLVGEDDDAAGLNRADAQTGTPPKAKAKPAQQDDALW